MTDLIDLVKGVLHWSLFMWRLLLSRFFQPILIFSMSKTGTTSVKVSLRALRLPNPVFHFHELSHAQARLVRENIDKKGLVLLPLLDEMVRMRARIDRTRGRLRWKVICLTRDPVAREVSTIFENPKAWQLEGLESEVLYQRAMPAAIETLGYSASPDYLWSSLAWFKNELLEVFGFDALSAPFDHQAGYSLYKTADADILIIRLEDLTRCGPAAFDQFLGLKDFRLTKANEGTGKMDKQTYARLKADLRVPGPLLDVYYNSPYARHFYSDAELQAFKSSWMGAAGTGGHQ